MMASTAAMKFPWRLVAPPLVASVRAMVGTATIAAALLVLAAPAASSLGDRREGVAGTQPASASEAYALAVQADGKVVVAGRSGAVGTRDFALARYTRNGHLDSSFGRGGKVLTGFGSDSTAWDVAIQADGKIVVAGSSSRPDKSPGFELARYQRDGSLDASFGGTGKVLTRVGRYSGAGRVVIQPDGKLVAVGWSGNPNDDHLALVRYTRAGMLDASFGRAGKVETSFGLCCSFGAAALQPNGKLVIEYDEGIARYNTDGTLDRTFGRAGKLRTKGYAYALALQVDRKIVVAGSRGVAGARSAEGFALARYLTDGSVDASFGSNGAVVTGFGQYSAEAYALAIQADGKAVAVGYRVSGGFAVARYTSDGALDMSFGRGGTVLTDFGSDSVANDVAIQPDGKIVVAGYGLSSAKHDAFTLARYRKDGSLDASFGNGGKVTTDFGSR